MSSEILAIATSTCQRLQFSVAEPDDGDGKKTMVEACSSAECSLWRGVSYILVEHQSNMELHQRVNTLLGINDLDWDGVENTICELRGYCYKPRPRRSLTKSNKPKNIAKWVAAVNEKHV